MKENVIINIGRQLGSGGRVIARMLADEFGFSFYDKELLNLAAKESGYSEKFFEQNDEKRGLLRSLFHVDGPFISTPSWYGHNLSQESLFKFQSDAIQEAADAGSCVFVGRCADYVLREYPNVLNVFITADLADRVARVAEHHGFDAAKAEAFIKDKESARATYYNYYTGKRWGSSESYDLCINSSILGLEETEKYISLLIKKKFEGKL